MVKIDLFYDDNCLRRVTIYDHANFAKKGQDLVCAGVSAIAFGMANSFYELCQNDVDIIIDDKNTKIIFEKIHNQQVVDLLFEVLLLQIQTIANEYSDYIKIRRFNP